MHRSLGRHVLVGVAVAVAAALTTPAYAAAPAIDIALPDVTVAAGGSTQIAPILFSDKETIVTGATAVYQLSGDLDGVSLGMADEFSDCTSDGPAKLTCTTPWETWISPDGAIGDFVVGGVGDPATQPGHQLRQEHRPGRRTEAVLVRIDRDIDRQHPERVAQPGNVLQVL
ncbi:hypothetical protein [Actinoplanes sp. NPDC049599]|uniref:hypothetical protein n=1 Tax=Actinoplanes sp. NPDC049599 TaxID=3363903 RepID=UPI0037A4071C